MRVIGGKYRHRRFEVPPTFKARPTTDFAKEGLFDVLSSGHVDFAAAPAALDLFAGTGSISLELLSRGCGRVVSVELDAQHFRFLAATARELGDGAWTLVRADVFRYLRRPRERFGLVFADPPYALPRLGELPDLVTGTGLLESGGLFVLEHGRGFDFSAHPLFVGHRAYGSVNFSLFREG